MTTKGSELKVGEGFWEYNGIYLGKLLKIETYKVGAYGREQEQTYTFEKGQVTGFDKKFSSVSAPTSSSASTAASGGSASSAAPASGGGGGSSRGWNFSGSLAHISNSDDVTRGDRLVKGKCYSHKGVYLGAYQSMKLVGSAWDPDPEYTFAKGKKSGAHLYFTEVPCQAGGGRRRKSRNHRRNRKNRRNTRRH